jgi:hypothetical protein
MKNKMSDLNYILFEQLERINDDELRGDALDEQLKKSKMIAAISSNIIKCGRLQLDASELHEVMFMSDVKHDPGFTGADNEEKELSALDKLKELLNNGVKGIMNSEDYKNYLDTRGRVYENNYSFVNAMLIYLQKPDAEHVMGFNAWKHFGRVPIKGSKSAHIMVPKFLGNSKSEVKKIINVLNAYRARYPVQDFVCFKLGASGKEITMNRAGVIGLRDSGKDAKIFKNEDMLVKYLDSFHDPIGWAIGNVFSQNDVCVPDNIWIRFNPAVDSVDDIVLDDKGKPVKNKKGEVFIVNTPERQARFRPALDMSIEIQDPQKADILIQACTTVCANKGVLLQFRSPEEDENLQSGAFGYFQKTPRDIDGSAYKTSDVAKYPGGSIVVSTDLDKTKQLCVLFHEIAHADLHKSLDKLSAELNGATITKVMREHQAESAAWAISSKFGIDNSCSFEYIAAYATGFALEELNKSMSVIFREVQALTKDISVALEGLGYDLELCPIVVEGLVADNDTVKELPDMTTNNDKQNSPSSYMDMIKNARAATESRSPTESVQTAQVRMNNTSPVIT